MHDRQTCAFLQPTDAIASKYLQKQGNVLPKLSKVCVFVHRGTCQQTPWMDRFGYDL